MRFSGGKRSRSRLGIAAVGLAALAAAATASASHPTLTYDSTFDSGSEGFVSVAGGNIGSVTWHNASGNPSGYIEADFANGLGGVESSPDAEGTTWPAGNALGDSGGTLGADVRVQLFGTSLTEDLAIGFFSSNTAALACEDLGTPASVWTTYSVTLDTSHLLDCYTGNPLSGAQASAALAGFKAMFVSAGNTENVPEQVNVDNVILSPPDVGQTPPTGKVARTLTLAFKRGKLSGSLVAANDYSCAGKVRLTIFRKAKKPVKVGTVTTSAPDMKKFPAPASFSFKLKKVVKGTYYASAAKATSGLDGNSCVAAKSKSVKVS